MGDKPSKFLESYLNEQGLLMSAYGPMSEKEFLDLMNLVYINSNQRNDDLAEYERLRMRHPDKFIDFFMDFWRLLSSLFQRFHSELSNMSLLDGFRKGFVHGMSILRWILMISSPCESTSFVWIAIFIEKISRATSKARRHVLTATHLFGRYRLKPRSKLKILPIVSFLGKLSR